MDLTDFEIKNLRWRYPRFFTEVNPDEELQIISGGDAKHISVVLRMKTGDKAVLSHNRIDYFCEIEKITDGSVFLKILENNENSAEANVKIRLFQCVPKSDKLEIVTQKATELGVYEIIPTFSERCVSRPDPKSQNKKIERLQKIAEEASKQSGRAVIPKIHSFTTFKDAVTKFNQKDLGIIFYECGGLKIQDILHNASFRNIDIFIGSEGGFTEGEAVFAMNNGIHAATLGGRILRTETAPIAAISILMNLTGNI